MLTNINQIESPDNQDQNELKSDFIPLDEIYQDEEDDSK